MSAEWLSEAAECTDASPTFAQPTISVEKAGAYLQASFEHLADTNIDSQIAMLVSDAKDRIEATAFATGSGTGQPWGIVSRLSGVTASRVSSTTNASFGAIDVYKVDNALDARHRDGSSWLGHWSVYNLVRQLPGADSSSSFWVDLGPGLPSTLLGHSTYESSAMQAAPLSSATASSDDICILGDFKQFVVVDRVGLSIVHNPLVIGSNRRPTGEVGWASFWRTGGDVTNADAFRMLRC